MLNKWLMNIRTFVLRARSNKRQISNKQYTNQRCKRFSLVFFFIIVFRFFFRIYFAESIVLADGEVHGSKSLCSFFLSHSVTLNDFFLMLCLCEVNTINVTSFKQRHKNGMKQKIRNYVCKFVYLIYSTTYTYDDQMLPMRWYPIN